MGRVEFVLPDVGEGLEEGEIVSWLVAPGDSVARDQPLVEVQTDKALVELPSPVAGQVVSLAFGPGDIVKVGQVLVVLEDGPGGDTARPLRRRAPPPPRRPWHRSRPVGTGPGCDRRAPEGGPGRPQAGPGSGGGPGHGDRNRPRRPHPRRRCRGRHPNWRSSTAHGAVEERRNGRTADNRRS